MRAIMADNAQAQDFWSDPEMFDSGDYIKFDTVGDSVEGTITAIKRHRFDDGKVAPSLELNTPDGPKTLTAGQFRLKKELAELRPGVGDHIKVTYTQEEKLSGGKTLKHFTVIVGPAPVAQAAPVAAPAAMPADHAMAPAPAQAAPAMPAGMPDLSQMTAEQLAAMTALLASQKA
jgi:hypothetical protein